MEQMTFSLRPADRYYSVSELTAELREWLNREYDDIRVTGEISGLKIASSGHAYFTLKDEGAQVQCVLYRNSMRYMKFKPQDGLAVVARGSLDLWEARGNYQLVVSGLEPQGYGALQLAFEQLKRKLEGEGLFAAERKRPLPKYPVRIGIVTSPTGAVIRDMLTVLSRRSPGLKVRLYPTSVQGEGATAGIVEGLRYFGDTGWAELVIAGRGGGSLEDLWAFNEEDVARAIAACPVPVISAVGHETDFTIADFVADLRAPTPSAAAEMAVPNTAELLARLETMKEAVGRQVRFLLAQFGRRLQDFGVDRTRLVLQRRIGRAIQGLDEAESRMLRTITRRLDALRRTEREWERRLLQQDLRVRLAHGRERLGNGENRLLGLVRGRLADWQRRLEPAMARLEALSPLEVLKRGYSIVETDRGRVVMRPEDAPPTTRVRIRLSEGQLAAIITGPAAGPGPPER